MILRAYDGDGRRVLGQSELTVKTKERTVVPLAWETQFHDEGAHDVVITVDPGV